MNKYRILLCSLYNDEAYGIRQLHTILYNQGYDCRMLFLKLNSKTEQTKDNRLTSEELNLLVRFINEFNPNLIGVSLVSSNFNLYKRIYEKIKKYNVLVGGWQASLNPEETIKYASIINIGEGEESVPELVDALSNNKSINTIKNIWINTKEGVIKNPVRPLITNFDSIPCLIFNKSSYYIENNQLINKDPYIENTRYGTLVGKHCPIVKCTYCSNSFMLNIYPDWSKPRVRSTWHVIRELKEAKEKLNGIKRINFYDEVFMVKDKEFFKQYKEEIDIPFYCMFYPGTCSDETAKELKEIGLAGVWVGVQSGSERVRKQIFKRYYSNDTIKKQAEIFKKYDISVRYDFIFDNPFETLKETGESIKLMLELPKPFSINTFSLKFFPNTEITKMALEEGYITKDELNDNLKADHNVYSISEDKKEILRKILQKDITIL